MATKIYKGQSVTLSTSEVEYELAGDVQFPLTTVFIRLISGTVSATVAANNRAPILDPTYTSFSTADTNLPPMDMQPQLSTLRMKCASAGVVHVTW